MVQATRPDWTGRTVVCIASGPSLTKEDCEAVHLSGHVTVVTNSTFRLCPWADVLFAHDSRWWRANPDAVQFRGRKISGSSLARSLGVESVFCSNWISARGNSGSSAIAIAVAGNASKIVLLGFDCSFDGDRKHWHADHPHGMSNCQSIKSWPRQFEIAAKLAAKAGVPVINASRRTALTCFERGDLETVLQ